MIAPAFYLETLSGQEDGFPAEKSNHVEMAEIRFRAAGAAGICGKGKSTGGNCAEKTA